MHKLLILSSLRQALDISFLNGAVDGRIVSSGGANATRTNSTGSIVAATTPRIDYDPVSLACTGLLIEPAGTNLFAGASIDGASLATQNVGLTAAAHTLSFYGTGTVTLSGAATAGPLVGSAVYPTRSTLTFTPSAGSVTFTVSGSVQYAQLETGSIATSFNPSGAARTADSVSIESANFLPWFDSSGAGTLIVEFISRASPLVAPGRPVVSLDDAATSYIDARVRPTGKAGMAVVSAGVSQADTASAASYTAGGVHKLAVAYAANSFASCLDGETCATDEAGTVPACSMMHIGSDVGVTNFFAGWVRRIRYWRKRLPNSTLQRLTA